VNKTYEIIYKLADAGKLIGRRAWFVRTSGNKDKVIVGAMITDLCFNEFAYIQNLGDISDIIFNTDAKCWLHRHQIFWCPKEAESNINNEKVWVKTSQ